ncbi:MAG: Gfo/Idh/MocA family oxidoreductase [Elusimicrobiota bacterium]
MKKIGFIDHYINNFHSNNYVKWIRQGKFKESMDVAYAFEETVSNNVDITAWCKNNKVEKLLTPEEVVEKSDYLMVLSPNNPERHWDLCEKALSSGKPVYVDKTFALDVKMAKKLIALAEKNNTPMFSTSALRYSVELESFINNVKKEKVIPFVSTRGPNEWCVYAIHQIEMMVMLIGTGAKRVMRTGAGNAVVMNIDYGDDKRSAVANCILGTTKIDAQTFGQDFELSAMFDTGGACGIPRIDVGKCFLRLIDDICDFYETRKIKVPHEQTLEVMRIIDAGNRANEKPYTWVEVEK